MAAAGRQLSASAASLLAWAGLAGINAAVIAGLELPETGARTRALHHLFDAGQLLFLGLVSALVIGLWNRLGARPRRWTLLSLSTGSIGLLLIVLAPDLETFALRTAGPARADALRLALVVVLAQVIPLTHLVGARLARPGWRWLPVTLAVAAGALNTQMFRTEHPGAHAFVAWSAAVLAGAALTGLRAPLALRRGERRVALAVLATLAAATVTLDPGNAVRIELGRLDTAILAAHVPPWSAPDDATDEVAIPLELAPWFASRAGAPPVEPTRPALLPEDAIVLLFTIDSMRSDVLSVPRNRGKLPTLERLRDTGFFVPRAITPSTVTRFTLGSLFTGLNVPQLVWKRDSATHGSLVKETRPRVAELLAAQGVATAHVVSQFELVNHVNMIGRGFAEEIVVPPRAGDRLAYAPDVMDAIVARLERHAGGPLFLFSHFMDAHHPFDSGDTSGALYDRHVSEVANIDRELARLDAYLGEAGLWPRTLLIVTADHGQAFGQHGVPHHGGPPYEEQCRVPLIVVGPAVRQGRSACDVPLIDLSPTLLDLFGVAAPGHFVGRSLVPALAGGAPVCARPVLSATWDVFALLLPDGVKILDDRRKRTLQVFDLNADPRETRNLCDTDPQGCATRVGLLRRYLELQGFVPRPR